MNARDDPEVKRYRAIRAVACTTILVGLLAGLAAVGAQAPERRHVTLNCAYDPAITGTLTDAVTEIPAVCAPAATEVIRGEAVREARGDPHRVPEAAAVAFPPAGEEHQPPTF